MSNLESVLILKKTELEETKSDNKEIRNSMNRISHGLKITEEMIQAFIQNTAQETKKDMNKRL